MSDFEEDADFAIAGIGDNGGPSLEEFVGTEVDPFANLNPTAQGQLKSIVERIERLEQEKSEIAEQVKEVKAEAKGNGFDTKIITKVLRIRKMDKAKREEEEALTDLYLAALEQFIAE